MALKGLLTRIRIIPLEEMRPHEEYDSQILLKITNSLMTDGILHDPLLVDSENNVILDGTHRYWALTRLGFKVAPVALYDYSSPEVSIGCWYRCVPRAPPIEWTGVITGAPGTVEEGIEAVTSRRALLSILYRDRSYTVTSRDLDIFEAYRLLSFFEYGMRGGNPGLSYATEHDAIARLRGGGVEVVLAPPPIKKSEVILAARTGRLFPLKSSRHIIRSRPIGLDIPLSWLKLGVDELAPRMESLLSSGQFKPLPRGTIINGRRYEEEVYIFEPSSYRGGHRGGDKGKGKVSRGS